MLSLDTILRHFFTNLATESKWAFLGNGDGAFLSLEIELANVEVITLARTLNI
jgi:hypothetical protein